MRRGFNFTKSLSIERSASQYQVRCCIQYHNRSLSAFCLGFTVSFRPILTKYIPCSDSEAPTKFYIFDARRQIAATLNMAAGKGTEDASIYNNTDLIFCDIDNIHVMRMSAITFADCNLPGAFAPTTSSSTSVHIANGSNIITSSAGTPLAGHRIGVSGNISSNIDMTGSGAGYYSKIEESGWLRYLRLIINASVMVAEKMHLEGASVLIHCSDGW